MVLDPVIAARLHLLEGISSWDEAREDGRVARRIAAFTAGTGSYSPPDVEVKESVVQARNGPLAVRVYSPPGGPGSAAGLVWLHGGGFTAGSLGSRDADTFSREICQRATTSVVSVDYHLCQDGVRYPVPHEDAVDAWHWAHGQSEQLGVAGGRWALGGASSGGNLAAGAALRLRDEGGSAAPCLLVLVYPALYRVPPPTEPELAAKLALLPGLVRIDGRKLADVFSLYYDESSGPVPSYVSPGDADLDGLPPVLVVASEYDDLRASGEMFARQLERVGVPCTYRVAKGMVHGYLNQEPTLAEVSRTLQWVAQALAAQAGAPGPATSAP